MFCIDFSYVPKFFNWIFNFIENHGVLVTILVALIPSFQYFHSKSLELKQHRLDTYHKLIERLASPLPGSDTVYLDIQKATVYELRNYPEHKTITGHIFDYWMKRNAPTQSELNGLMTDTLNELSKKRFWFLKF